MLAGLAFGSEIKRFGRSRMTRAAIVVLMLLPLVYGALYLWAYWDPFGHVNKMPVALVNSDRGAVVSGQQINAGSEIAKGLTADRSLDWHVVTPDEARDGVGHGKYYFMLELPPDFSAAIASPVTGQPRQANLIAVYNDANNYISTSIGRTAISQVLNAVSTRISGQAVNQVLSVVVSSGSGIKQAADGARQLADGAARVDDGASQLSAGLHTARSGSAQLAAGAKQLSDGINEATDPLLAVSKALSTVGGNSGQAGTAMQQAADQINAIALAQDAAANGLSSVTDQLSASQDPVARNAVAALRGIQDQLRQHQFTPQIRQQLSDAQNAAGPLKSALDQVGSKGQDLTNKLTQLRNGAQQLASGNAELASGIAKLDDGAQQLTSGAGQLKDGSGELATKLAEGAKQVPNWTTQQKEAIANTIGGPVQLEATHENAAPNFGTGMAPFFLTLALFFGALVLWMVLRPLQNRAIAAEVIALRVALSSYIPAAVIGIVQAVILYGVVRFALGMHAAHPVAMLAFMILVSWAFVAATQAINALVGPAVGRVLIMALLMLQLVSAGGMYPVETTSKPFQVFHHFDPMTYGVNGLRQLILGGIDFRLWQAVIVLIGIWAVALAISSLSARRNRLWNLTRLLPSIKV
ncbi:YhgE/Pip family protein [uncultured Mycobacterium sp.]|uniref:YhgE/Pip family protein n=1 Tax=uncultured Mycobacterium sp. TaxID=171292 RepID=UPI0035CB6F35